MTQTTSDSTTSANSQPDSDTDRTGAAGTSAAGNSAADSTPVGEPDWQQKYVYLYAEFENYKKRAFKERQDIVKYALESPAGALLEVMDNFERALQFAKPDADPNLLEGLKMVMSQFRTTLEKQGITEVATQGQAFNPELHEAVGQIASEHPAGQIAQVHQKGYTLHGRLIRPARVLVSTGKI